MSPDPRERFLELVRSSVAEHSLHRLVLSRPARPLFPPGFHDEGPVLQRVRIRPVRTREGVRLGFSWQYDTRDQSENLPLEAALARVDDLLGDMRTALLETSRLTAEMGFSKRGRPLFRMKAVAGGGQRARAGGGALSADDGQPHESLDSATTSSDGPAAAWRSGAGALTRLRRAEGRREVGREAADDDGWGMLADHNRHRQYPVDISRPFLVDLGIVGGSGALVPAMARKWRQINKFVEIVASAWQRNPLSANVGGQGQRPLRIHDYGAGKGYLTFALHDYFADRLGLQVETVGIERRADLVALCNRLAGRHGMTGLRFKKGDILQADGEAETGAGGAGIDIIIALHACDTATDEALYQGIRQQAAMLVCSPCCHRELRPQLQASAPVGALLRHGIHREQQAEMLTDGLRALLLEAEGYEAQVFEFISPEHTGKNKMILGNRTGKSRSPAVVRPEIEALKDFYGICAQRLDDLLRGRPGPDFRG
ncbi:MAG: SAM-dependent methyltransferase [Lautropia sp.]|nr:SAM-dependent methyltransferase [Lautropia sp.]